MLDIREMLNFIRIVEAGSFSRAADVLHIAQPTLSQQVKNLEATLQRQLLIRHSRGVQVTEAGRAFLVHGRRVRDELSAARRAIADVAGPAGRVSLGMTVSSNDFFFGGLIDAVHRDYPRIKLNIVEGTSSELVQKLQAGQVDLACLSSEADHEFASETLIVDEMALLSSKFFHAEKAFVTFKELCDYPLVLPPKTPNTSPLRLRLEREAEKQGLELNVTIEAQSESLMRRLAEQGTALAILPYRRALQAQDAAAHLHVIRIVEPTLPSVMCLAYLEKPPMGLGPSAVRNILIALSVAVYGPLGMKPAGRQRVNV